MIGSFVVLEYDSVVHYPDGETSVLCRDYGWVVGLTGSTITVERPRKPRDEDRARPKIRYDRGEVRVIRIAGDDGRPIARTTPIAWEATLT